MAIIYLNKEVEWQSDCDKYRESKIKTHDLKTKCPNNLISCIWLSFKSFSCTWISRRRRTKEIIKIGILSVFCVDQTD